ncbi:hypothetical protein CL622_09180 [archaeon]|nr:hypothetical protein [archaeon]
MVSPGNKYIPQTNTLPTIKKDTALLSDSGITFVLTQDLDFSKTNYSGELIADTIIGSTDGSNNPATFILSLQGLCVSGEITSEQLNIGDFTSFLQKSLAEPNVSQVISVTDDSANEYHEVDSLLQDTIYKSVTNIGSDVLTVTENLKPISAPYRYTTQVSLETRKTTLIFGGGNAATLEDDVIPDPSEFAIPLYGKTINKNYSLDPNRLLNSNTYGTIKANSVLTVRYRHGGGLDNNCDTNSINTIDTLYIDFPPTSTPVNNVFVRNSIDVTNLEPARGGADQPSTDRLRSLVTSARNSQNRIVTKQDLLARVYTMPTNFGQIFRASVKSSQDNPYATRLYLATQNQNGHIDIAPDALKKNLRTFINNNRLITDSVDMLDASVINIGLKFEILVDKDYSKRIVLQKTLQRLKEYFKIDNFHIEQPISFSDVKNIIYNTEGVISIMMFEFNNLQGVIGDRQYSDIFYSISDSTYKGLLIPTDGSIFEVKFPLDDIIGTAN